MRAEQEKKRARLDELYRTWTESPEYGKKPFGRYMIDMGVDVTLPPEPEWKPGQYVMLRVRSYASSEERLAQRTEHRRWRFIGPDGASYLRTDAEVTDVEPVAVLTAEDVQELVTHAARGMGGPRSVAALIREFFAERGLNIEETE